MQPRALNLQEKKAIGDERENDAEESCGVKDDSTSTTAHAAASYVWNCKSWSHSGVPKGNHFPKPRIFSI